jgi:hypothetical protein
LETQWPVIGRLIILSGELDAAQDLEDGDMFDRTAGA